jgi:Taurine catabolism dioxygenase TauD, TfdA family
MTWINELQANGWALVSGTDATALDVARQIGRPVPAYHGGDEVQLLRPLQRAAAPDKSLSAAHGLEAFPLHTDAAHHPVPPRYIVMRFAEEKPSKCATLLVPVSSIKFDASSLRALRRDVWLVSGGRGKFTTTILDPFLIPGHEIFRYDAACMRPVNSVFKRSGDLLKEILSTVTALRIKWTKKSCLIIDNWHVLHGREAADENESRILERVLVQ